MLLPPAMSIYFLLYRFRLFQISLGHRSSQDNHLGPGIGGQFQAEHPQLVLAAFHLLFPSEIKNIKSVCYMISLTCCMDITL